MKASIRKFCEHEYTVEADIQTMEKFTTTLSRMLGMGIMEYSLNGVKFIDKGQVDIDKWNKRKQLLNLGD
jgi:hypothetical protein